VQLGPFLITRKKAQADLVTHVPPTTGGWWPYLREGFAGAWQRSVVTPIEDALTHPTFWACVTLIAGDIAKIRPRIVKEDGNGIETEVNNPSFSPVIRQPNHYQDRIDFFTYWILSKLCRGNAYALKERDNRGVVSALYLLDPTRVRPMVGPTGDVFYQLGQDLLAGVTPANVMVPAREIIHDKGYAPYHPLVGLSPVYASGHAALQSLTINRNASQFAQHGSLLGGVMVAPGTISEQTSKRLEEHWNSNYAGPQNAGKIAVIGDGLSFQKPDVMSAVDAEVINQLKWDDEKICSTFHVPPYMVGVGPLPSYNNVESLGQQYYSQCLQILIEKLELCLSEGLGIGEANNSEYCVDFDEECLLRMDSVQKMEAATKGVIGGIYSPNEARAKYNLPPVTGGDKVYLQKQNWPLDLLGKDATTPTPVAAPSPALLPVKQLHRDRMLAKVLAWKQ
jgi:HK97 family phage portal protein